MKWDEGHQSANVIDRRGGGGGGRRVAGIGIVGTIIVLLLARFTGIDVTPLLGGGAGEGTPLPPESDADRKLKEFVSFVLDDVQATWHTVLGTQYRDAKMVLFTDAVETRCGHADSGVGPFYCGGDQQVYIDLRFYRMLDERFGAPGDFAQAYVIAHEIGHHVQHLQGVFGPLRERASGDEERQLSIRQELQADCYAGVWAYHSQRKQLLEEGDLEEGLRAAAAIGDDTLQRRASGHVEPESWTHGSSAQRVKWFRRGFERGQVAACDTLAESD